MDFFKLLEVRRSIRDYEDQEIHRELGIPEGNRILWSIIIGYPKAIPPMPERKDPEILKIIS